jgi:hypothetical protein
MGTKSVDEKARQAMLIRILDVISESLPTSLRCTKVCRVYDDAIQMHVSITDDIFHPILVMCLDELEESPFSADVSILYHKIHQLYRKQRTSNSGTYLSSSILMMILKICLLKKDMIRFDYICTDIHAMEQYDDDLVANVQRLYGVALCKLTVEQESETASPLSSPHLLRKPSLARSRSGSVSQEAIQEILDKKVLRDRFQELRRKPSIDTELEEHELVSQEKLQDWLQDAMTKAWQEFSLTSGK